MSGRVRNAPSASRVIGRRNELTFRLKNQVRRLKQQADPRLLVFAGLLLALDLFFVTVFSIYRLNTVLDSDGTPSLGSGWQVGRDWSYAEVLGYSKLLIVVTTLASIPARLKRPVYPGLALVFTVVLLDDALRLHERWGGTVASALALPYSALGELMVWAGFGLCLLTLM
ncbi:MAG TPA: hypothetical protein VD930_07360, partial [Gemmatimonadales bacterium]|nr:hypothetical protein [Gemmatimonadales bacterium]